MNVTPERQSRLRECSRARARVQFHALTTHHKLQDDDLMAYTLAYEELDKALDEYAFALNALGDPWRRGPHA